jgi:Derlin-2/3
MAAILGGDGGIGEIGQFPLEQWFFEMPPCTRYWTTATVLTAILTQCKIVNPLQLYYSFRAVYVRSQVNRNKKSPAQIHSLLVFCSCSLIQLKIK